MKQKFIKINDPIHGFLILPDIITPIVDSAEVQRLTRIRQLSGASNVYPGANHTRFEHSLGVAGLAQRMVKTMVSLHGVDLDNDDLNDCVVAALCHDIGHGPFSHNFEGILLKYHKKDHEDYTVWLIENSEIGDRLESLGFDKKYIADLATGRGISRGTRKATLISELITGAINADSMDYLLRDNYHCGTQTRAIDINRLLIAMDELENGWVGIDMNTIVALEGYLLARITAFRTIYFHKTCRAVQLMLTQAMLHLGEETAFWKYREPDDYLRWDDYTMWSALIGHESSAGLMEQLRHRKLWKCAYESPIEITEKAVPFTLDGMRERIAGEAQRNVLNQTGLAPAVTADQIFLDIPSSSSVPYSQAAKTRPNIINSFRRELDGSKTPVNLEEFSPFFKQFKGHLRIIRVYTPPEFRNQVEAACGVIFQDMDSA